MCSVYIYVLGVIDTINSSNSLKYEFPSFVEQQEVVSCFRVMSDAGFDRIVRCIDGVLVPIIKPVRWLCKVLNCGQKLLMP